MICHPHAGWCDFRARLSNGAEFLGHPSYRTDVPLTLLNCFLSYFQNGSGACFLDEEGTDFTLILCNREAYLLEKAEEVKVLPVSTDIESLAKELLQDIARDFDSWVFWNPEIRLEDYDVEGRKKELEQACNLVNTCLKKLEKENQHVS